MSKDDVIEAEGKVIESLPNATFKVQLSNGHTITAYISGKLRMNYIRIIEGDNVKLEMSPYDLTKGRITWRSKSENLFGSRRKSNKSRRKNNESQTFCKTYVR